MKLGHKIIAGILLFTMLSATNPEPNKIDKNKKPRNVILMIGDGCGLAQWCAAYAANGFVLDIFTLIKVIGLMDTQSADNYITDSAAGATAFSIGEKTNNGVIGLTQDSIKRETILEQAKKNGKSTGLVVTCSITHATPASFFAHEVSRDLHKEIAKNFYAGFCDMAIGGGKQYFDTQALSKLGYSVVTGSNNILNATTSKLVGFYSNKEHEPKYIDGRSDFLKTSSMHVINKLNTNKKGFFLMIEGSQIDWGGHKNDSNYVISETLDFDKTVKSVLDWAKADKNTLVIITADHETGGLGLTGFDTMTKKPWMKFHSKEHTGIMVPVFAFGPGSENFAGVYQNTEIYRKIKFLMGLK